MGALPVHCVRSKEVVKLKYKKVKEFKFKVPEEIETDSSESGYAWIGEEILLIFKDGRIFMYQLVAVYESEKIHKALNQVIM